jgi:hypothetical protein
MKTKALFLLCLFTGFGTISVLAQEWTKEQKEVWQVCENSWKNYKAGNISFIAAVTHPKYQGWDDQSPLPYSKEKVIQLLEENKTKASVDFYEIEPARIVVTENAAVIDYYYNYSMTVTQNDKKEVVKRKGMYVEFYVKEKGSWLLLADMTTRQ